MLDSIPQIGQTRFNWPFIAKSCLALVPIILMSVIFMLASRAQTGYFLGTFDVVLTHYNADNTVYSPLLPTFNRFFKDRLADQDYNVYFGLMAVVVCLYAPFVLLWRITGSYRYPIIFLYGCAIPLFNLINGTIPQAIVIDFMLLGLAFPPLFLLFTALAALTHSFGLPAMAVTWLWMRWRGWKSV